jgi:hypothetical protein
MVCAGANGARKPFGEPGEGAKAGRTEGVTPLTQLRVRPLSRPTLRNPIPPCKGGEGILV